MIRLRLKLIPKISYKNIDLNKKKVKKINQYNNIYITNNN